MDPYIILAKTEQGAWIETKEMGRRQWSLQQSSSNQAKQGEQEKISCSLSNLVQEVDPEKGHLIYLTWKGSFQVILYKMIRFLSEKLKKHTKLAKIVEIAFLLTDWSF